MKIFGLCLVKNEADCIEEILLRAYSWCDRIFVFDTGSEDDTWERVVILSKTVENIIPYKKEIRAFNDNLRSEIFNYYKHLAKSGDWWCRLDADEIYIDDPRLFLTKISRRHHVVWNVSFQYYFTEKEQSIWQANPEIFNQLTLEKRLLHYACNHSEARFFRHRDQLEWAKGSWPKHLGIVSPLRIRLKHFQYRSPEQIEVRLLTRQKAILDGHKNFASYSLEKNWIEKVENSSDFEHDHINNEYVVNSGKLPRHIERWDQRLIKYILHGIGIFP